MMREFVASTSPYFSLFFFFFFSDLLVKVVSLLSMSKRETIRPIRKRYNKKTRKKSPVVWDLSGPRMRYDADLIGERNDNQKNLLW